MLVTRTVKPSVTGLPPPFKVVYRESNVSGEPVVMLRSVKFFVLSVSGFEPPLNKVSSKTTSYKLSAFQSVGSITSTSTVPPGAP